MTRLPPPIPPPPARRRPQADGLVPDRDRRSGQGRIGGAARGRPGLGRLLAEAWGDACGGQGLTATLQLWAGAQADTHLPEPVRIRAASALDPTRR